MYCVRPAVRPLNITVQNVLIHTYVFGYSDQLMFVFCFSKAKNSKTYSVNVPLENVSLTANGSPPYDPHAHRILEHPTT